MGGCCSSENGPAYATLEDANAKAGELASLHDSDSETGEWSEPATLLTERDIKLLVEKQLKLDANIDRDLAQSEDEALEEAAFGAARRRAVSGSGSGAGGSSSLLSPPPRGRVSRGNEDGGATAADDFNPFDDDFLEHALSASGALGYSTKGDSGGGGGPGSAVSAADGTAPPADSSVDDVSIEEDFEAFLREAQVRLNDGSAPPGNTGPEPLIPTTGALGLVASGSSSSSLA